LRLDAPIKRICEEQSQTSSLVFRVIDLERLSGDRHGLLFASFKGRPPRCATTAPSGEMQLAGPKDVDLAYAELELEFQNGNPS
jgi:hypothetical protein